MKPFTLIALLFSSIFSTATAQYFPVDTARLNNAYRTLEQGICTEKTEMEFLKAFPTTWLEFYMTYCNRKCMFIWCFVCMVRQLGISFFWLCLSFLCCFRCLVGSHAWFIICFMRLGLCHWISMPVFRMACLITCSLFLAPIWQRCVAWYLFYTRLCQNTAIRSKRRRYFEILPIVQKSVLGQLY